MAGHYASDRPDAPDAARDTDSEGAPLARAIAAGELACDELAKELALLDEERGGEGASAAAVERLVLRGLPDLCGLLAPHLRLVPSNDTEQILDHLLGRPPFNDQRMCSRIEPLRAHVGAYGKSLTRWAGWDLDTHDLATRKVTFAARWLTARHRREDEAVAADFVGLVDDPADLAEPDPQFAAFARDAQAALEWLDEEYVGRFRGLRLWIVGSDGLPVVRWLKPE